MQRRAFMAVGGSVLVAGCPAFGNSGDFDGEAAEYLLTVDALGEVWAEDRTYDAPYVESGIQSDRARDFANGSDVLTVVLAISGSPGGTESLLSERRSSDEDAGLPVESAPVADEAVQTEDGRIATVDAYRWNVFFEAYGDVDLATGRRIGAAQDEKLSESLD